ncbi:hypothetical protein [Vibrio vulnificus]|uniref:hypothetical protein n=1 Tax=Vibrio vulnificus TaxID=672 RepID=UPI002159FA46|nr:hypothetical protein [Vibrio vulnificus]
MSWKLLSRFNFAIIIVTGIHLQKGKMMAITIRDTQEHEQMLSKLKQQTGETTLSKALLKGGYEAIRYRELCASQQQQIDELRSQLYKHHKSISCFFDALDGLKGVIEKGA